MQAIAYTIDGQPRLTWPAVTDILDPETGEPTGETTDNLQSLIAALPPGTEYTLVDATDAGAWWEANKPAPTPEERRAAILARLAEIDAASVRPLRAIAQGEDMQADHTKLTALDAEAADLRAELAGLGQAG